jgi:hypothetical protein
MFDPAKLQMNWASARGRISLRAEAAGLCVTAASLPELTAQRLDAAAK